MLLLEFYNFNSLNTVYEFWICLNVLLLYLTSFYCLRLNFFMQGFSSVRTVREEWKHKFIQENIIKPIIIHTLLIYCRSPTTPENKLRSFVAILALTSDVNFQANPSQWGPRYSQEVSRSSSEGLLAIDQSHSYLQYW